MPRRTLSGRDVEVDESGFLVDALAWTPEIAEELARETGLGGLTPRHWRVVLCCREAAARDGSAPDLGAVSRLAGLPPAELDRLFRRPSSGRFPSQRLVRLLRPLRVVAPDRRPFPTAEVDRCPMTCPQKESKGVN